MLATETEEEMITNNFVAQARTFARMLNATLDELEGRGIDCLDVRTQAFQDPGLRGGRRVELILQFGSPKPTI